MATGRRLFLQKSAGAGFLTLLMRGPVGRIAARLSTRAANWGGLRFSTGAVRAALPHPAVAMTAEAVAAATSVMLAGKAVSVFSRPASTSALLRISTAAVREQFRRRLPQPG